MKKSGVHDTKYSYYRKCVIYILYVGIFSWGIGGGGAKLVYAQDLWDDSGAYFTNVRQLPVGTIVTLEFTDDFTFAYDTVASKDKLGSYADITVLQELLGVLSAQRTGADVGEREIDIETRERLRGSVGAVVANYDPTSDTYTLTVNRQLLFNGQDRTFFNLTAQVNGKAISENNTLSANELANLNVTYVNDQTVFAFTEEDFASLYFPSQAEIKAVEEEIAQLRRERREAQAAAAAELAPPPPVAEGAVVLEGSADTAAAAVPEVAAEEAASAVDADNGNNPPLTGTGSSGVTNRVIVPRSPAASVTNRVIVQRQAEIVEEEVLPELPKIEIELTAAKKREIFLQLLNIMANDWY